MKQLFIVSLFMNLSCYPFEQKEPPAYSEFDKSVNSLQQASHIFFLEPIDKKDPALLTERAECYFTGKNNCVIQPLMGYAHLVIGADLGDGHAAFQLAERLSTDPLVDKTHSFNLRAKYYGQAAKKNNPQALSHLRALLRRKIDLTQVSASVPDKDITTDPFLTLVYADKNSYTAQEFTQFGYDFLKGTESIKPDQLRALALFCVAFHKYPDSQAGAQGLTNLIEQSGRYGLFKKNNSGVSITDIISFLFSIF